MDIVFKGRHTEVLERFRSHARAKLARIVRLDSRVARIDVEVSTERNPRQAGRRERVELTISSRGPVIRAEAAAEDRFTALDMAFAKLESRLRRSGDRRKCRHAGKTAAAAGRPPDLDEAGPPGGDESAGEWPAEVTAEADDDDLIAIPMEGEGPLIVRQKAHDAQPMSVDQALFEMELVGHDFYLFRDTGSGQPSVVYRRRGYQYGLLRLVEGAPAANGQVAAAPDGTAAENGTRAAATVSRDPQSADGAGRASGQKPRTARRRKRAAAKRAAGVS
ncbi:MAG TPA: ribosome-associated translation inhibitor RaiA [Streptosporangiaceae bacterium]|jgi:ribosomal subunit interface protein|nr:ribosome-associated translation inhibitor RaiA [Streptosporangiaceae bacterium]